MALLFEQFLLVQHGADGVDPVLVVVPMGSHVCLYRCVDPPGLISSFARERGTRIICHQTTFIPNDSVVLENVYSGNQYQDINILTSPDWPQRRQASTMSSCVSRGKAFQLTKFREDVSTTNGNE